MKKRWNKHLVYPFEEHNKLSYKCLILKVSKTSHYPKTQCICKSASISEPDSIISLSYERQKFKKESLDLSNKSEDSNEKNGLQNYIDTVQL
jgi:hypothetical protein